MQFCCETCFDPIYAELQNLTDMTDISVLKYFAGLGKSLGEHAILHN